MLFVIRDLGAGDTTKIYFLISYLIFSKYSKCIMFSLINLFLKYKIWDYLHEL